MKPREKRQQRTQQAILDAARQIITEKGIDRLSMRAIAKRIDYSPAGLYEYFGSKEEIIAAVCGEGHKRLRDAMARVDASLPPVEYMLELGEAYVQFALQHPDFFLLMFTFFTESNSDPEHLQGMEDSSFPILIRGIEKGVAAGIFKVREGYGVMEMALNAWFVVHGVAMLGLNQLKDTGLDLDHLRRESQQNLLRGFMH